MVEKTVRAVELRWQGAFVIPRAGQGRGDGTGKKAVLFCKKEPKNSCL
jgi:hypothetical protein